jgi:hypothetical protein
LGRQPQPGARPRRLAAKPSDFQLPTSIVGATLYRPLRIDGKRTTPTFQRQVARLQMRRRRLSTQSQLVQAPMGRTTLLLRKATPFGRSSHRHRTLLVPQTMVSKATQHGHRDHPLPRLTRIVLS